jgi:hypothetical protein
VGNGKYQNRGWLDVKIHIFSNGSNLCTTLLLQIKFCRVKDHGHMKTTNLI